MRTRLLIVAIVVAGAAGALAPRAALAAGFRDIASVTLTTYFDATWQLESTDVFLARVSPALTLEARLRREDSPGYYQHILSLGTVVNFSDTVYAEAVYGLGLDSALQLMHEAILDLNYETSSAEASLGVKANLYPSTGYYYFLPSISGKFHLVPSLGLFGKFFLSVDSAGVLTESFWGEAEWQILSQLSATLGFTVSRADLVGYSLYAGARVDITPAGTLEYSLQYLSDTVQYIGAPQPRSGLVNALVADFRF